MYRLLILILVVLFSLMAAFSELERRRTVAGGQSGAYQNSGSEEDSDSSDSPQIKQLKQRRQELQARLRKLRMQYAIRREEHDEDFNRVLGGTFLGVFGGGALTASGAGLGFYYYNRGGCQGAFSQLKEDASAVALVSGVGGALVGGFTGFNTAHPGKDVSSFRYREYDYLNREIRKASDELDDIDWEIRRLRRWGS